MTVLKNGNVYLDGSFKKCDILFDERIVEIGQNLVGETEIDLDGKFVTPGFIDIHIHGRGGFDVSKNCGEVAKEIAKCGVTSFLPTTLTLSYDD
ncbi:MAG: amidohydrolase family protein, partial [Clostridia bacterium]|nr:amidohydrolase family protein [Clostridia bacterium]